MTTVEVKKPTPRKVTNLQRDKKSGIYYARLYIGGKEKLNSLRTRSKSVAVEKLAEHTRKVKAMRVSETRLFDGKMLFKDLARMYQESLESNSDIAPNTALSKLNGLKSVLKAWPELATLNVRSVTTSMCESWAERFKKGKAHVPHGAKQTMRNSTGVSASKFNAALIALRECFDIAEKEGAIFSNPARSGDIKQMSGSAKKMVLPTRTQFADLLSAIETSGAGQAKACADLVRFLAFTGARLNEADNVAWEDIDLVRETITLRVTKNGETRRVPMIAECVTLVTKLQKEATGKGKNRKVIAATTKVLQVSECQKSLDSACKKVGIKRITHHDLRHFFATICIESGMDIPTLARLLGHKDGGALAMRVYGHLRDDHAQAMMARVSFSDVPKLSANPIPRKPAKVRPQ